MNDETKKSEQALCSIVEMLAEFAVEDYLKELEQEQHQPQQEGGTK